MRSDVRSRATFVALGVAALACVLGAAWFVASGEPSRGDVIAHAGTDALASARNAELEAPLADGVVQETRVQVAPRAASANAQAATSTDDAPRGSVRVRLVDAEQQLLTGLVGELSIRPRSDGDSDHAQFSLERPLGNERRVVAIPANGEHVFEGLTVGMWTVECRATGAKASSTYTQVAPWAGENWVELRIVLQRTLRVALREPSGASLVAALDQAHPGHASLLRARLLARDGESESAFVPFTASVELSNDDGYWRSFVADTRETLDVSLFYGDTLVAEASAAPGQAQLTLVASLADLRRAFGALDVLVVGDEDGAPLAGVTVRVQCACPKLEPQSTDERGLARFEGLAPDVVVDVQQKGRVHVEQRVRVAAGESASTTVRLQRGVTISGRVQRSRRDNGAAYLCLVEFVDGVDGPDRGVVRREPDSDADPLKFRFDDVPRGEYVVMLTSDYFESRREQRAITGTPAEIKARRNTVYVDARRGDVQNAVLVVNDEAPVR